MKKFRSGFSMIELVLVMTILGIVASISSSIIVKVYESYIVQRATYRASVSTEIVSTEIANRLTYSITDSLIARKVNTSSRSLSDIRSVKGLRTLSEADKLKFGILEWIGYDNDSFSATHNPGWSGFDDVNRSKEIGTSGTIDIFTAGSNLNSADSIIRNLGRIGNKGSTMYSDGAIIFSGSEYSNFKEYSPSCMGFVNDKCISKIKYKKVTETPDIPIAKNVDSNQKKIISDQYRLVWSAYAIVPENENKEKGTFDLFLYSNYQPWKGEVYKNGDRNILAKNVTQFKFFGQGSIIRFKICIREDTGFKDNDSLGICKEKVVIK